MTYENFGKVINIFNQNYTKKLRYIKELPPIKDVFFDIEDKTTTIVWEDGEKTKVKCAPGEKFNYELGVAYAIIKRVYTDKGEKNFSKLINKAVNMGIHHLIDDYTDTEDFLNSFNRWSKKLIDEGEDYDTDF